MGIGSREKHTMSHEFKIIQKRVAYQGFFKLQEFVLQHTMFAGGWSPEIRRECLERGHAVAVIPYDPKRDEVVLIEQFRIGALDAPGGPWLLEIVAGIVGPGETKPEVAQREAWEEAGCEIFDLEPICEYLPSAGGCSEIITLYCGLVDSSAVGGIHGLTEEHEDIRVQALPREEAMHLLHQGRFKSAAPIIALQWLDVHYRDLKERAAKE